MRLKLSFLLAATALAGLSVPAYSQTAPAAGEWGTFGIQTANQDTSAKPGDDFNRFVNGKWIDATEIPADRTSVGSFVQLRDLSEVRMHAILDELVASYDILTLVAKRG